MRSCRDLDLCGVHVVFHWAAGFPLEGWGWAVCSWCLCTSSTSSAGALMELYLTPKCQTLWKCLAAIWGPPTDLSFSMYLTKFSVSFPGRILNFSPRDFSTHLSKLISLIPSIKASSKAAKITSLDYYIIYLLEGDCHRYFLTTMRRSSVNGEINVLKIKTILERGKNVVILVIIWKSSEKYSLL